MKQIIQQNSVFNYCLVLYLFTTFSHANAQNTFMKRFDMPQQAWFKTGIQTEDNGYAFMGYANYHANVLVRLDSAANLIWKKDYGYMQPTYYNSSFNSMIGLNDNGFLMLGSTPDLGTNSNGKSHLLRLNSLGDTLWSKRLLNSSWYASEALDAVETVIGDLIVVGRSNSGRSYYSKLSATGDTIWNREFGGSNGNSELRDIHCTSDGNYIVTGYNPYNSGGATDMGLLMKFNDFGDTLWTKSFRSIGEEVGMSVNETTDGGFVFCGKSGTIGSTGFIIKTDSLGNQQWNKQISDSCQRLFLTDIIAHADGSISTYGYSSCDTYLSHRFLIKLDADGNELWTRRYTKLDGVIIPKYKSNIAITSDDGYLIPGTSIVPSFANFHDMVAVKLDPLGFGGGCDIDETSYQISNSSLIEKTSNITFHPISIQPENFPMPIGNFNYEDSLLCFGIFPLVNLGQDTSLCIGSSLLLSVNGPGTFLWSDNSTDSTLLVTQPGTYWVHVLNGSNTYSDSIVIEDCLGSSEFNNLNNLFKIFPNPTRGALTIEFSKNIEAEIILYDLRGNKVRTIKTIKKTNLLDLKNLEPGIYYIFLTALNESYKRKIVIH